MIVLKRISMTRSPIILWAKKRSALLKENDSINSREVAGGPLAAHMGNVKNRGAQKWDFYNDHFQT